MRFPETIAIDFDGTLAEDAPAGGLRWRPWAREFLLGALAAGYRVWLHTCRATFTETPADEQEAFWRTGAVPGSLAYRWQLEDEMRAFLEAAGAWGLVLLWTSPGKPIASRYYDDRAEPPDWLAAAAELGIPLVNADPGGTAPLGGPTGIWRQPGVGAGTSAPAGGTAASTAPAGPGVEL